MSKTPMSNPSKSNTPSLPVPAATVMLLRQQGQGLKVLMTERNKAVGAFGGALAFPGGKLAPDDDSQAMRSLADGGDGLDDHAFRLRVAAVRETFEETGLLLARAAADGPLVDNGPVQALAHHRTGVADGTVKFSDVLGTAGLRPALDRLVPWARWVTPAFAPKRFDTFFFAAMAPDGQQSTHDGSETVDHLWIAPTEAIADAEAGRRTVIFVTRMNLLKLNHYPDAATALAGAAHHSLAAIEPERIETESGTMIAIRPDAGYPVSQMPIATVLPQPTASS